MVRVWDLDNLDALDVSVHFENGVGMALNDPVARGRAPLGFSVCVRERERERERERTRERERERERARKRGGGSAR